MRTFDVHLVIGTTRIILKGASEYSVTTSAEQPSLSAKAPKGGQTVYSLVRGSNFKGDTPSEIVAAVTIHEIDAPQVEMAAEIPTQPSGDDAPGGGE